MGTLCKAFMNISLNISKQPASKLLCLQNKYWNVFEKPYTISVQKLFVNRNSNKTIDSFKLISPLTIPCRNFRTSQVRAVHPILLLIIKPAAKFAAILTGRGFRKWWANLPKDKRGYFQNSLKNARYKILGFLTVTSILSGVYYESHMKVAPLSKRRRFIAFTPSQMNEIADFEFKLQYETYKPLLLSATSPQFARVSRIVQKLLAPIQDMDAVKNKNWAIAIIGATDINAFVLPRGEIFVFDGILKACENDDQLAVILAHEISHSILGHAAENLSLAHLMDFAIIAILAALWAFLPSDGIAAVTQWFFHKVVELLLDLPYSRMLEIEADEIGLQLLAKACYDVRESSAFWAKMSLKSQENLEWLSTHPNHESRSEHLDSLMEKAMIDRKDCGCGDLSKTDPRKFIEAYKTQMKSEQLIMPISI